MLGTVGLLFAVVRVTFTKLHHIGSALRQDLRNRSAQAPEAVEVAVVFGGPLPFFGWFSLDFLSFTPRVQMWICGMAR